MSVVNCHVYRDHWMRSHRIDPDYMHYKAMAGRSRAAVVLAKVKEDHISAKQIDFSSEINKHLINVQRFFFGFLNGTSTISSSTVCTGAMVNLIDKAFELLNFRFVWLPEYSIKFT